MRITAKQYAQTLYELTEGKSKPEIEKAIAGFARQLMKSRKLRLADKISEQFLKIYNEKNGIIESEIISRKKLNDSEIKKIEQYILKKYHGKEAVILNKIDESIKGGFILRVGDEVVDGSVRGKLNELKKALS